MDTQTNKVKNRYVILLACAMTGGSGGAIYMWSIFNQPRMALYGWSPTDVSSIYSVYLLFLCITGFFAGWLQKRVKPKLIVVCAGTCFSLGWFLMGSVDSLPLAYLCFSLLAGGACGFSYNTVITVTVQWFPDKRGFANGIVLGALALSSLIFAPLGNYLIETYDVHMAFHVCGIIFLVVFWVFGLQLVKPPAGWLPKGYNPADQVTTISNRNYTTPEMLKTVFFWVLFFMFALASTGGMLMTGHGSSIGQNLAHMTAAEGALMVGILAITNFIGRLGFGTLSDRIGRYTVLMLCIGVTAVDMIVFPFATSFPLFIVALCVVGMCFGGLMVTVPAVTADAFGSANYGQNYAFVYCGYTVAALVGPTLGANVFATTGSFNSAFLIVGILEVLAFIFVIFLKRQVSKMQQIDNAVEKSSASTNTVDHSV